MARYAIQDTIRDTNTGQVISSATVTIYLAGGLTLATAYIDKVTGTALVGSQTTTDTNGHFVVYVDTADYVTTQNFKYIASKAGYTDWTEDDIDVLDTSENWSVEHNVAGAHTTIHSDDIITKGPWIDVTHPDFGATGDGTTDDTTAIQAAINAVAASGGVRVVYLPSGTYIISGQLTLSVGNIVIKGDGNSSIIKVKNGVLESELPSGFSMLGVAAGLSNINIMDLQIDGNADNNTLRQYHGVGVSASDYFTIKNCTVKNVPQNGVYLPASTTPHTNFSINHNRIENIGWRGIQVDYGQKGEIINNSIISTGSQSISVRQGTDSTYGPSDVKVAHNYINRATPPTTILTGQVESDMMIILGLGATRCIIDSNICYDNRNAGNDGIAINANASTDVQYQDIVISNNIVTLAGGFGIDTTSHCTCTGNIVLQAKTHGIVLAGDLGPSREDTIIADNLVENPGFGYTGGANISGILVTSGNSTGQTYVRIKITDNIVRDEGTVMKYGVHLDATYPTMNHIEISHNDLHQFGHSTPESIHMTNPSNISDVRIHDNTMRNVDVWQLLGTGATPSVLGHTKYHDAGGGSTITNFLNGYIGQEIWVVFDGARTIQFSNVNLFGNNGTDWAAAAGDQMKCVRDKNGDWRCVIDA